MEEQLYGKLEGRYYKQGRLAYQPEDGVVYDDVFKIPLNTLLTKTKITSIPHLRNILDENGYIGRASVKRAYQDNVYPLNEVKIKVELVWSEMTYKWPLNGTFSLDYNRVLLDPKAPPVPSGMASALRTLYTYRSGSPYALKKWGDLPLIQATAITEALRGMGVIREGELKLCDDTELEEVIANLLTDKYYI